MNGTPSDGPSKMSRHSRSFDAMLVLTPSEEVEDEEIGLLPEDGYEELVQVETLAEHPEVVGASCVLEKNVGQYAARL